MKFDWMKCFLTDRTQRVVFGGIESFPGPVLSGVPQGSFPGPILFFIYINHVNDLPCSPDGATHSIVSNDGQKARQSEFDIDLISRYLDMWRGGGILF